jgi:hypothetical protein
MVTRRHVVVAVVLFGSCASAAHAKLTEGAPGIDLSSFFGFVLIGAALGVACAPWTAVIAAARQRRDARSALLASLAGAAVSVGAGALLVVVEMVVDLAAIPGAVYLLVLGPPLAAAVAATWLLRRSPKMEPPS